MSNDGNANPAVLLDKPGIGRTVARIAHQIIEKTELSSSTETRVILLGITTRGVPLAKRLADRIWEFSGADVETGVLDITLYRDDLREKGHRSLEAMSIPPAGIDDAIVILVDDVLFSGRTIRAALDALRDVGRPRIIQLATLVDRGHRALPIRPDYVGQNIESAFSEKVKVTLEEVDGNDAIILVPTAPSGIQRDECSQR